MVIGQIVEGMEDGVVVHSHRRQKSEGWERGGRRKGR